MNGWLCGTGCFVIRLKEECNVRFAFLQISSPIVKAHLEMQAAGVTMMNLNQGILSALEIPLPLKSSSKSWPKSTATKKSSTVPGRCSTTTSRTSRLIQLGLSCGCPKSPSASATATIKRRRSLDRGIPSSRFRTSTTRMRWIFPKHSLFLKATLTSLGQPVVRACHDTLYSVTGSFGIPVFVDSDKQFCFQRHIALLRPSSAVDPKYLYFFMCSPSAFKQATQAAPGVAQKTVSLGSLRNFIVPLPPRKPSAPSLPRSRPSKPWSTPTADSSAAWRQKSRPASTAYGAVMPRRRPLRPQRPQNKTADQPAPPSSAEIEAPPCM